jgi:hypothetical protein
MFILPNEKLDLLILMGGGAGMVLDWLESHAWSMGMFAFTVAGPFAVRIWREIKNQERLRELHKMEIRRREQELQQDAERHEKGIDDPATD